MGGYTDPPCNVNYWGERLSDFLVLFDQTVTNGNYAMGTSCNIVFMRNHDDRIAFTVQAFEEIHDFHAGVRVKRASWFIRQKN
jgi:hypothetical protein